MPHLRIVPRCCLLLAVLLLALRPAQAQEKVTKANYKQAFKYSAAYLRGLSYDSSVTPNWIGKSDTFWYSFRTSKGTNYYLVDPKAATRKALFDKNKVASQLSELTRKAYEPINLPLTRLSVNEDGSKLHFVVEGTLYRYELAGEKLTKVGPAPPAPRGPGFGPRGKGKFERKRPPDEEEPEEELVEDKKEEKKVDKKEEKKIDKKEEKKVEKKEAKKEEKKEVKKEAKKEEKKEPKKETKKGPGVPRNLAPDRKSYASIREHNLYFGEVGKEKDLVQLTRDGKEDYGFGVTGGGPGAGGGGRRLGGGGGTVNWAPDSRAFYATRTDVRGLGELYLINSLATPRPTLEKYKYTMPGEEKIRKSELYVFHRPSMKVQRVAPKWVDERYTNIHWSKAPDQLRFVREDRLHRNLEFCVVNVGSGEVKCLIKEGFEAAPVTYLPARYLDSGEMIWWSERSGWGHYYLYDRDCKLKNAITSGAYRASQIVAVDEANRLLYYRANAREDGENVYYQHLYCVRFDGTGLTLMDPGNANHISVLSPSRQFVVDTCSRTDMAPMSVLRDAKGKKIMDLEKADLSRLIEAGWKMPETFTVKAADGVTTLYGNLWKPFDFNPKKKYPIIAHVYPGPQMEGVTHTFVASSVNQQLAQLGFIVIQVGNRGGTPTRSKAYASYGYYNLRDYGLADKKTAIEQLAARFSFIDIERVGIYGHSGGGFMSAAAVLQKPYNEFFKAAVASAGNHDNNVYNNFWSERYHGLKEVVAKEAKEKSDKDKVPPKTRFEIKVPTNTELAANLKGALLLVHGDMDNNVHPAGTIRLVDALVKANKRFDMLILPGKRHAFGDAQPYFTQRKWDFFADHLLGDRRRGADIYEK